MQTKPQVLIIEDDERIVDFLSALLKAHNYDVKFAYTASDSLYILNEKEPDLILLDLGLPDLDGQQLIKQIRLITKCPVIVISAREQETEKVKSLDSGADDYVTKPFGNKELLARIRSVLRRHEADEREDTERMGSGGLEINFPKREVYVDQRKVHLTPMEYNIVSLLAKNSGKVLTHDTMLNTIWGYHQGDNQVLRVNMANIRRKLERNPADPKYILTEVGVGYRMVELERL